MRTMFEYFKTKKTKKNQKNQKKPKKPKKTKKTKKNPKNRKKTQKNQKNRQKNHSSWKMTYGVLITRESHLDRKSLPSGCSAIHKPSNSNFREISFSRLKIAKGT